MDPGQGHEHRVEAFLARGIVDVWPLGSPWPVRLEFFGDELESLREFDPARFPGRPSTLSDPARRRAQFVEGGHAGGGLHGVRADGSDSLPVRSSTTCLRMPW